MNPVQWPHWYRSNRVSGAVNCRRMTSSAHLVPVFSVSLLSLAGDFTLVSAILQVESFEGLMVRSPVESLVGSDVVSLAGSEVVSLVASEVVPLVISLVVSLVVSEVVPLVVSLVGSEVVSFLAESLEGLLAECVEGEPSLFMATAPHVRPVTGSQAATLGLVHPSTFTLELVSISSSLSKKQSISSSSSVSDPEEWES